MSKLVALAYDASPHHAVELYRGVDDYIRKAKLDWRLIPLNYAFESRLVDISASGHLDGIIGSFVSDEWIRHLTDKGVKAVNLFHFSDIRSLAQVSVDDLRMGYDAGNHLQEQGAQSLTYFSRGQSLQNRLREQGLLESAKKTKYFPRRTETEASQIEAILKMPKPAGILCASDQLARRLIIRLREANLKNKWTEALVVGIGNEEVESIFAGISISSFRLPTAEIGARAAKKLEALMAGEIDLSKENVPAQLIARASSLPTRNARLATAAYHMAQDAMDEPDLDIAEMARRLGVSRRTLEISIREEIGESPYQLLSRLRCERACSLLVEDEIRIGEIGRRCGYPEAHHFSSWFKQRTGLSPKAFRQDKRTL